MSLSRPGSRRLRKLLTALGSAAVVLALASVAVAADPPSLSVSDPSVTEGDSGSKNATFVVSLSAPSTDTVIVDFATADSSAAAPADYAQKNGTLTFAPGETSKPVTVAVAGDTMDASRDPLPEPVQPDQRRAGRASRSRHDPRQRCAPDPLALRRFRH